MRHACCDSRAERRYDIRLHDDAGTKLSVCPDCLRELDEAFDVETVSVNPEWTAAEEPVPAPTGPKGQE